MANYFNSINIALRALQVQKKSLDVTGHNIANANTEGYSRQRAIHAPTDPYTAPAYNMPAGAGQIGTGVKIEEITRIRDDFIDGQIREESQAQGYWDKRYEGLHRIELIFNEPGETSLNYALDMFWDSLQDLSTNANDPATRSILRQRALTLVDNFHSLYDQLKDYQQALNRDVQVTVDEINSLGRRIADLNQRIVQIKGSGQEPNDLLDQRDLLFDELNQLVNVQGTIDSSGSLNISLGGASFVTGERVHSLTLEKQSDPTYEFQDKVIFVDTQQEINLLSGELAGIIDIRDNEIGSYATEGSYLYKLHNLAKSLVEHFNEVHQQGYDQDGNPGGDFFTISTGPDNAAAAIDLVSDLKAEETGPRLIAAGRPNDNPEAITLTLDYSSFDPEAAYQVIVQKNAGDSSLLDYTVLDAAGNPVDSGTGLNPGASVDLASIGINFVLLAPGEANIALSPGSGDNAVHLANALKKDEIGALGDISVTDYYESIISAMGVDGQRAKQMVANQEAVVTQLTNQRASISGVSLDEEMANMIKYQQAYNAAAKIVSVTDEVLDVLMGIIR